MNNLEVQIIKKIDKDFLKKWYKIWKNAYNRQFYNSPEWFISALKVFEAKDYLVFTVSKDSEVKLILPLIGKKFLGRKIYMSPGEKFLDKTTILLKDKDFDVLKAVFKKLANFGNFYLSEVDDWVKEEFEETRIGGKTFISSESFYLPLEEAFEFLSKKQKSKIKNKYIKNKKRLTFLRLRGEKIINRIDDILKIDYLSSKREKSRETFSDKNSIRLLEIISKHSKESKPDLSILYFDRFPVVFSFGVISDGVYHAKYTSFVKKFAFLSPGKLLLYMLLPKLRAEGVKIFDFSRGDSTLKKEFTPYFEKYYDIFYSKDKFLALLLPNLILLKDFIIGHEKLYQFLLFIRRYVKLFGSFLKIF